MKEINSMIDLQIVDRLNVFIAVLMGFLTAVFGKHWLLFALYFFFNVADWLTGWYKARVTKTENSIKGWQGVLKKMCYWLMIAFAFSLSAVFVEIGTTLGMNLGVTTLLGWFVLAGLMVNEARSILENFVAAGLKVPSVLIRGLEVANQMINSENKKGENKYEDH